MITDSQAKQIIGFNLERMLRERGMTQADLVRRLFDDASQAGRMAVYRWVRGKSSPTPADIVNLAEALQCSTDEILGEKHVTKKI